MTRVGNVQRAIRNTIFLGLVALNVPYTTPQAQPPAQPVQFDRVFDLGSELAQTVLQDTQGFLWFGTRGNGLFRYDSYDLKHYPPGPGSLSDGTVYKIVQDIENPHILWLATVGGGLNRLDTVTETVRVYRHDPHDPTSLSSNALNDLVQDRTDPDILWIATPDAGLIRFDKTTGRCRHYRHEPGNPRSLRLNDTWRLLHDRADPDILWVATWGGGLNRFHIPSGAVTTAYLHDPDDPHSFGGVDNAVAALTQDQTQPHLLWLGTIQNGLDQLDTRTGRFTHFTHTSGDPHSLPTGPIAEIYDDGQGRLWLGGWVENNGLMLFDKATHQASAYQHDPYDPRTLSNDFVQTVFRDRSGIYWITTTPGNVDKYDPYNQNFRLYQQSPYPAPECQRPHGLSNDSVNAIYEDRDGVLWFGTKAGLSTLDRTTDTWTHYLHDPANPDSLDVDHILDVYEDSTGTLWVTTLAGPTVHFDRAAGRVTKRYVPRKGGDSFTTVLQDPDDPDLYWLGVRGLGFARLHRPTDTFTYYPPNPDDLRHSSLGPDVHIVVHDQHKAGIWMGGWFGGGLVRFDKPTETFTHYRHDPQNPQSLSADVVLEIMYDSAGRLWVGTRGGGLNRFEPATQTFQRFTEAQGVPANVNAILEDQAGHLWLSTNQGIIEFDPASERVVAQYRQSEGLQGDVFLPGSALKTRDGQLWFGGTNGANCFDPDALTRNQFAPPVVLTSLTQGGEPLRPGRAPQYVERITLDWGHCFFEFEMAALNFTRPTQNQYAYLLEGFEDDWYMAGTRRFGRYSHLPPGRYTLRIKGANNDGVWNEAGVALDVIVIPPFWRTWWFYLLCAVGVSGVIGLLASFRLKQVRAERTTLLAIRDNEARLRHVLENMPVMLNAFDEYGNILVWNRECERVTGYTAEEMLHNPDALAWLYPDETYRARSMTELAKQGYDFRNWEWNLTAHDGSVKTIAWSNISEHFPVPGWATWAVGVDVTDRRQAEAEIRTLNAELERRVQERTAQLEASNRELNQFAYIVSHDLKAPLRGIAQLTTWLTHDYSFDEPGQEMAQLLISRVKRMEALIDGILDYSRAGRIIEEDERIDLNELVREVIANLAVPEHIRITLDGALPSIRGDEIRLTQVFQNLLSNAVKFMDKPAGEIQIGCEGRGEFWEFRITDNGPGIPKPYQQRIFQVFHTLEARDTRESTGIGLAIVKKIIELHGGVIWVESSVGQGSTFVFTWPKIGKVS